MKKDRFRMNLILSFLLIVFLFTSITKVFASETLNYLNSEIIAGLSDLEKKEVIIVDARNPEKYRAGHIPGAISLWWEECGYPDLSDIKILEKILGEKGISREKEIILYDEGDLKEGYAGRIFWMLEYLGSSKVRILNGGFNGWLGAKKQIGTDMEKPSKVSFKAVPVLKASAEREYISKRLNDPDFLLIDTRTDEEYNGWALNGEKRGGHIKNAISIKHRWFFNDDGSFRDYKSLKEMMDLNGISPDKEVAAYGTYGVLSGTAYFVLRLMGYKNCANYDGSYMEWSKSDLPVEKLSRYEKLVNAAWVDKLIKNGNPGIKNQPSTYPGKGFVIVHASSLYWKGAANPNGYDPNGDYITGHIPGAINIPLNRFDVTDEKGIYPWTKPSDGNILPAEQLKKAIENFGINHDTTVVVYCGNRSYIGGAYRVAWALMYAGVKDVRYLNGDIAAWVKNGGKLETKINEPVPVSDFGVKVPVHPEYLATNEDIEKMVIDKNSVIADDRSWTEFTARDKKACIYDFFCVPGHVPNAVWVQDMYWYLDDFTSWRKPGYYKPATLKSYTIIKKEWEKRGLSCDKKIAFYCGGGWRSSLVWFYAYLMGYPDIKNFDGGWYDWTWNTKRPIAYAE